MRLRVKEAGKGRYPNEIVVEVEGLGGPWELTLDRRSVRQGTIEVGHPVARSPDENYVLVELPSEAANGAWRVWVDKRSVVSEAMEAAE